MKIITKITFFTLAIGMLCATGTQFAMRNNQLSKKELQDNKKADQLIRQVLNRNVGPLHDFQLRDLTNIAISLLHNPMNIERSIDRRGYQDSGFTDDLINLLRDDNVITTTHKDLAVACIKKIISATNSKIETKKKALDFLTKKQDGLPKRNLLKKIIDCEKNGCEILWNLIKDVPQISYFPATFMFLAIAPSVSLPYKLDLIPRLIILSIPTTYVGYALSNPDWQLDRIKNRRSIIQDELLNLQKLIPRATSIAAEYDLKEKLVNKNKRKFSDVEFSFNN